MTYVSSEGKSQIFFLMWGLFPVLARLQNKVDRYRVQFSEIELETGSLRWHFNAQESLPLNEDFFKVRIDGCKYSQGLKFALALGQSF